MDVERRLRLGPPLRETLSRITEDAARLLSVEGAGLRLLDGDELVRVAMYGPAGAVMGRERLRVGESVSGRVAASGRPLILADSGADLTHRLDCRAGRRGERRGGRGRRVPGEAVQCG